MTKVQWTTVSLVRASFIAWFAPLLTVGIANAQAPNNSASTSATSQTVGDQEPAPHGAWELYWVQDRHYYDPLLAELRAARVTAIAYAKSSKFQYQVDDDRNRTMWDISVGEEIPIVGIEGSRTTGQCDSTQPPMDDKCWGFSLSLPVSFHMVEDFEDDSTPVINTDYRFSLLAKAQRGFAQGSVAMRLQVGHESTHLGDEFTLHAQNNAILKHTVFDRVNVTYEYWEYGLSIELRSPYEEHVFTFRHGGIGLLNNKKGFYAIRLLDYKPGDATLTASKENFEPSFGFEWRRAKKPIKHLGNWAPLASIDLRLKTVYDYRRPANTSEEREWSVSALVGVSRVDKTINQRGVPIFIGRFYYGVNPNGQFRNQSHYREWGLGFIVPL